MKMDEIEDLVSSLTPAEISELSIGLMKRARDASLSMSVPMASALAANLRVAGWVFEAEQVETIRDTLIKAMQEKS